MKLLRMTASFGKLENETLELTDGLNVITRENEAGKSTWAAFLLTMLYGLPPRDKRSEGYLPYKEKFAPWSGREMGGTIDLIHEGRAITIERSKKMSRFSARDTKTGEPIDWLTGENCGEVLLGAERSVYLRSAFIGQGAAAVTQDAALEQRLQQLVAAGDEQVSFSAVNARLQKQKNQLRNPRNEGLLPAAQAELQQVEDKLERLHDAQEQAAELSAQESELKQALSRLAYIRDCLRASQAQAANEKRRAQQQLAADADAKLAALTQQAEKLPTEEALFALKSQLLALRDAPLAPAAPAEPTAPKGFEDCHPERAEALAEKDAARLRELQTPAKKNLLWLAALLALLAGGALAALGQLLYAAAAGAVGLALGAVWLVLRAKAARDAEARQQQAQALCETYAADSPEALLAAAVRYTAQSRDYAARKAEYDAALREQARVQAEKEAALLDAVRKFADRAYSLEDAERELDGAVQVRRAVSLAQVTAASAQQALDALPPTEELPPPPEDFTAQYSLSEIEPRLAAAEGKLQAVRETLSRSEGAYAALGDPSALQTEREALLQRIQSLTERLNAVELAQKTLAEANETMRAQFSPQLAEAAAEKLAAMTDGKYERVLVQQDLSMLTKTADDAVSREMLLLSGGTLQQLYLALRLAICNLTLRDDAPIVLDDAFAFYDDARLKNALKLLTQEAKTRQILLLTCQTREAALLAEVDG